MKIEEKFVETKYGRICYLEAGEGPKTLIFFHGFLGDPEGIKYLSAVLNQKGFRVVALYLPGHGKSFKLPKDYSFLETVESLSDFVDIVCPGNFSLFGASLGGGLAWSVAKKKQNRLEKLILHTPLLKPIRVFDFPKAGIGLIHDWIFDQRDCLLGKGGVWPTVVKNRITQHANLMRLAGLLKLISSVDLVSEEIGKNKVLFMWGESDHANPYSNVSNFVQKVNGKIEFFPGGHFMFLRQFPKFLDSIVEFVSK